MKKYRLLFCLVVVLALVGASFSGNAEDQQPDAHGNGVARASDNDHAADPSFLLPYLEKKGVTDFIKACPQFNPKINGNTIWSPYYWHVRAVGAHLVQDRFHQKYDPLFAELKRLVGPFSATFREEANSAQPDQAKLLAIANDLANPDAAKDRQRAFQRYETRRDRYRDFDGFGRPGGFLFRDFGRNPMAPLPEPERLPPDEQSKLREFLQKLPKLARVAVIDAGMDVDNPWIKSRVPENVNFGDRDSSEAHAVHVAGVIGGIPPVGIGTYVEIYPFKTVGESGRDPGDAYRVAAQAARITNGSWGFSVFGFGGPGEGAFRSAAEETTKQGVSHFMAAGNEGQVDISEGYDKSIIKVGAFTATNDRAEFSCVGNRLNFMGYGAGIWSAHATQLKDERMSKRYPFVTAGTEGIPFALRRLSGTSMASPVAAGVGANLISEVDDLNRGEISYLMAQTAISSPNSDPCLEGAGSLNNYAAQLLTERYKDALGKPTIALGEKPTPEEIERALKSDSLADQRTGLEAVGRLSHWDYDYDEKKKKVKEGLETLAEKVIPKLQKKIAALNDFRGEAANHYKEATSLLSEALDKQDCATLEKGVKALEKSFFLGPGKIRVRKDLALTYAMIGLMPDAVRIYGGVSESAHYFSPAEYAHFNVDSLLKSDDPQIVSSAYKIKLRHAKSNEERLALIKEALAHPDVPRFLGEVVDMSHIRFRDLSDRVALNALPLFAQLPATDLARQVPDMKQYPPKDPIVRNILAQVVARRTGEQLPQSTSGEVVTHLDNPQAHAEFMTNMFGDKANSDYRNYVRQHLIPSLTPEQAEHFVRTMRPADTQSLLKLYKDISHDHPPYPIQKAVLSRLVAPDSGVTEDQLLAKDPWGSEHEGKKVAEDFDRLWAEKFMSVDNYFNLYKDRKVREKLSRDHLHSEVWRQVYEDKKLRDSAKPVIREIADAVDAEYNKEERGFHRDEYERCQASWRGALTKWMGWDAEENDVLPLICPHFLTGEEDLKFLSSLYGKKCFSEKEIGASCGSTSSGFPRHGFEPGGELATAPILQGKRLHDLAANAPQFLSGYVGNLYFGKSTQHKEFLEQMEALFSDPVGLKFASEHELSDRDRFRALDWYMRERGVDGIQALLDKTPDPKNKDAVKSYSRILGNVCPSCVMKDALYPGERDIRMGVLAADSFDAMRAPMQKFVSQSLDRLHQLIQDSHKPYDNDDLLQFIARVRNERRDRLNLDQYGSYHGHSSAEPAKIDYVLGFIAQLDSETLKKDVDAHPELYSASAREKIKGLPDYNAIRDAENPRTRIKTDMAELRKQEPWAARLSLADRDKWLNDFKRNVEGSFGARYSPEVYIENLRDLVESLPNPEKVLEALPMILELRYPRDKLRDSNRGLFAPPTADKYMKQLDGTLAKKLPVYKLYQAMGESWRYGRGGETFPDTSDISPAELKGFLSQRVTEENYWQFYAVVEHLVSRIGGLPPETRELLLNRKYGLDRTNMWR